MLFLVVMKVVTWHHSYQHRPPQDVSNLGSKHQWKLVCSGHIVRWIYALGSSSQVLVYDLKVAPAA